jgi:CRP-like cAMP-binding protein
VDEHVRLDFFLQEPVLPSVPSGRLERNAFASLTDQIEVPEGKVLTREGDQGSEFFVVVEGQARVMVGTVAG